MRTGTGYVHGRYKKRLFVAVGAILGLIALLSVHIAVLQIVQFDTYALRAEGNRVKLQAIVPPRGRIFDRNGAQLADNELVKDLIIRPKYIRSLPETLAILAQITPLGDARITEIGETIADKRHHKEITVYTDLDETEFAQFSVIRHRYPEFAVESRFRRTYAYGAHAAHILGYVGKINREELARLQQSNNYRNTTVIGKTGIEKQYESLLHGIVGYREVETNKFGAVVRTLNERPPRQGSDLFLSIDIRLQRYAEQLLQNRRGAVVVLDNRSGEVLTLASMPTYNPNNFVRGLTQRAYEALIALSEKPLFHRAIRGQYPPGSTVKPQIALAGLENNVISPEDTTYCPGHYSLPGSTRLYRDWKKVGHGDVDVAKAIVESCDVFFYVLAQKLGIDRLHDYLTQFQLGRTTGIDLPGELPGLIPSAQWKRSTQGASWYTGETLITGIGQGYMLTTPLQLATATATIANRGVMVVPQMLYAVRAPDSDGIRRVKSAATQTVPMHDAENWQLVIDAMYGVVHHRKGTARRSGVGAAYTIAGKTGTAQIVGAEVSERDSTLEDHAVFVAFAPVVSPEVTIAVLVENAGSGSGTAAPIARKILDYYFAIQKAAPDSAS